MKDIVYRIQDKDGRGPFKPGFSHKWLDTTEKDGPPSWIEEFGLGIIRKAQDTGLHIGCACRTMEDLNKWFSRGEKRRLKRMGYEIVEIKMDYLIAEGENQVLFGNVRPLKEL